MSFLFILLFIFILFFILFPMIGSRILQNIFRSFLGLPKKPYTNRKNTYQETEASSKKKKMIGKEEGEYIDFEEVVEEKE